MGALTNAFGEVVEQYHFEDFGLLFEILSVGNLYRFLSLLYDPETVFYWNFGNYDPFAGRPIQRKPPDDVGNQYTMWGNDPISFVDPLGPFVESFPVIDMVAELVLPPQNPPPDEAESVAPVRSAGVFSQKL